MKIGIIGAGAIGGTLGRRWVMAGHEVLFAVRHPEAIAPLLAELGERAHSGTMSEAAAFGSVLLFAAPYGAWPEFARHHHMALVGKLVIDAANPYEARDGAIVGKVLALGHGAGSYTASLLPHAYVVKAFNTIHAQVLRDAAGRQDPKLAIPLVGDDASALSIASKLILDAGYDVVHAGELATSAKVDPGAAVYGASLSASDLEAALAA